MTPLRVLIVCTTVSAVVGLLTAPVANAARTKCFGRRATILASGPGRHRIYGTNRADVIVVRGGSAKIHGRGGNDRICTSGGDDRIRGGKGNDRIKSGRGKDRIGAGKEDDRVRAGRGHDVVRGAKGFDDLRGGRGSDSLGGGPATDVMRGGKHNDTIDVGLGRSESTVGDRAFGGRGNDEINGSDDPDQIFGGPGDDVIHGGMGTTAELVGGIDLLYGQDGDDHITSGHVDKEPVETRASFSFGGEGADLLEDLDGVGTLAGGPGDDELRAPEGSSDSALDYSDATEGVAVDLAAGIATGEGTDVISGSFDLVEGSAFDDELIGEANDESLLGYGGNDELHGGDGDDSLLGGEGDDLVVGGAGEDWAGWHDVGELTVDLSQGSAEGEGNDVLEQVENVSSSGNDHVLIGDDSANEFDSSASAVLIEARGGDDLVTILGHGDVDGGDGDDFIWAPDIRSGALQGGAGADVFQLRPTARLDEDSPVRVDGGTGPDGIDFSQSSYSLDIDLSAGTARFETGTVDSISYEVLAIENVVGSFVSDVIRGDDGPNRLLGGPGPDEILGRGGDDDLDGGEGRDRLDGGEGIDRCANGEQIENCEG